MAWGAIKDWFRMRRLGKLGIVGIIALICAGVSAHAALRAIVDQQAKAEARAAKPVGYEAEDHFPGAAWFYIAEESPTPGAGTTGTTRLPDMPLPPEAASLATDASIRPAQPFSMKNASPTDRARALQCLTTAIYYEAATEPDAGQQAVAQVILNRMRHPAFPATVCGVVYQGSERGTGCQFSFACDGSMARVPSRLYWLRAMKVAAAALNGHVFAPVGLATHYHTYAVTPSWNRSLVMTAALGAHFFHRWQGWWGTPAAFSQHYAGGEPLPGPHARPATPDLVLASAATAAPTSTPPTAPASIQPAYAQSGTLKPAVAPADTTGESQILDRWKDSGKPLR
ncbi:cell wall hydrolase [Sphingomonas sp. QA11]|uniref:cell wall hydrolase n=1 Tax=Sphingomonas sp. QA11 TaxID=2950605 RepID=UPI00234BCA2E|nr:cell wall hydrolase [Sphingomonas sp. QA11]WCM25471.1 cell wall hydrolase [Sphingomonas sp. QA11]